MTVDPRRLYQLVESRQDKSTPHRGNRRLSGRLDNGHHRVDAGRNIDRASAVMSQYAQEIQRMRAPAQLLKAVAAVFVLAMTAHSAGLIYYNRHSFPTATIGASYEPPNGRGVMPITQVVAQGPAERAGLRAGDRIRTVNGQPLVTAYPLWNAIDRGRPGDTVALAVLQPNGSEVHDAALQLEAPVIPFDTAVAPITAYVSRR